MAEPTPKIIFSMMGVHKMHNRKVILKDINLSFYFGAKIGVLGLNGSGKSSLLRVLAGQDKEYEGRIHFEPGYSIGMLEQEPRMQNGKTVKEVVMEGVAGWLALHAEYDQSWDLYAEADETEQNRIAERQAWIQSELDRLQAWDVDAQVEMAMDALRCPPPETIVDHLSGGERRRVALARLLLHKPDILLLDEPTNHLDAETVHWLEQHLRRYEGTVIAVTHDRYFLDNVAGWILELDHGHGIPWKGNYASWLEQKQQVRTQQKRVAEKRDKALARELEWIRKSPKARQAKSQARITAYENLLNQNVAEKEQELDLIIPAGPRLGSLVVEAKDLSKAYGENVLFDAFNWKIAPGSIIGVIGPNGAGKTTLCRMITGEAHPDAGSLRVGETVKIAYVDQSREALPSDKTVWEVISDGQEWIQAGGRRINSRGYCNQFGFVGGDQQKPLGMLSGGERNRVHLARILKSGGNLLILDEPTNDLDVHSIRALEEALESFAGCAIIVSHDRWFLDRVATHILAFEGNSEVHFWPGDFSSYMEDYRRRKGVDAERPHRMKYRQLSR
jgi:ATP-binding cassette ChvD family protein